MLDEVTGLGAATGFYYRIDVRYDLRSGDVLQEGLLSFFPSVETFRRTTIYATVQDAAGVPGDSMPRPPNVTVPWVNRSVEAISGVPGVSKRMNTVPTTWDRGCIPTCTTDGFEPRKDWKPGSAARALFLTRMRSSPHPPPEVSNKQWLQPVSETVEGMPPTPR